MKTENIFRILALTAISIPFFISCDSKTTKDEPAPVLIPTSPRSLTASNGKLYIVLYDGRVAQMDTSTFIVEKSVTVGSNPDKSVISNNKLYVANTGGMQAKMDSTISVIDLSTFKELKKIKVNLNPSFIKADSYGDIYVASNGDYKTISGKFQRIEAGTEKVTDIALNVKGFDILDDNAYTYNFSYDENWQAIGTTIAKYNVKNEILISSSIAPNVTIANTPYGINLNPTNQDIYLCSTDYKNNGKVYVLAADGSLKYSINTGLNPSKTVPFNEKNCLYILNEGKFKGNNSSITYYNTTTSTTTNDYFNISNNRALGDTGEDMIRYGSKIYVSVYNSNLIEIIDINTGKSIKTIPMVK